MLAKLSPAAPQTGARHLVYKQVPGTRCSARSDASKTQPGGPSNRCQALGAEQGRMLAKQTAQIGARH